MNAILYFFNAVKHDIAFSCEIRKLPNNFLQKLKVFLSPRMVPVFLYRVSFLFYSLHLNIFAKFFSLLNFLLFGIEIATNTRIGLGIFFPHTQGTVIGAKSIGNYVIIYHSVTIGAKFIDSSNDLIGRPTIGNNVKIATGSIIIGEIMIGDNVIIGPNLVINRSLDDNSKIVE